VSNAVVVGKLPSHGDFVARGVDARERHAIDAWLTASMAHAREQLGASFEEAFDCAPPWQFAWHDQRWTAGVLAPSVDSAGRRFPLLVARKNLDDRQVRAAATLCEEAAANAISKPWKADELASAVESADLPGGTSGCRRGWWNDELGDSVKLEERRPADILSHMLSAVIAQ
jgi:type VI secretion system protein ImpM